MLFLCVSFGYRSASLVAVTDPQRDGVLGAQRSSGVDDAEI